MGGWGVEERKSRARTPISRAVRRSAAFRRGGAEGETASRTRNAPPRNPSRSTACRIDAIDPLRIVVSAWRKRRIAPLSALSPTFIFPSPAHHDHPTRPGLANGPDGCGDGRRLVQRGNDDGDGQGGPEDRYSVSSAGAASGSGSPRIRRTIPGRKKDRPR